MIKIVISFCIIFTTTLKSQEYIPVFPELEGEELRTQLIESYKPSIVLNYSQARDTMFGIIDNFNDSLRCVYSGHTIYLNPNEDPTQAAFMNAAPNGINTEHTYPQSLGAEFGNARSDMHHLFPTRSVVNSARGNKPFDEIEDNQTDVWYFLNSSQQEVPGMDIIDFFSESTTNGFEPPENHKGDVARAMFYFYTMYQDFADGADSNYFNSQAAILCKWHLDDPVDEKEFNRTQSIAGYQDGKANPFIYDCSLASRLFCPLETCETTAVKELQKTNINVYPNPANDVIIIELKDSPINTLLSIINMNGEIKFSKNVNGESSIRFDTANMESGMYIVTVSNHNDYSFSKFIILK